jgi:hypothetical protein
VKCGGKNYCGFSLDTFSSIRCTGIIYLFEYSFLPKGCTLTEYMSRGSLRKIMEDNLIDIGWKEVFDFSISLAKSMDYLLSSSHILRNFNSKNILVQPIYGDS